MNERFLHMGVDEIGDTALFGPGQFSTVLALDSVYHFADKRRFFADCARKLKCRKFGVTDVLLKTAHPPWWLRILLRLAGVQGRVLTAPEYDAALKEAGFVNVRIAPIRGYFAAGGTAANGGFAVRLFVLLGQHLDYASVVAENKFPAERLKNVAIVGSGVAGLAAASELQRCCSVTVFEAKPDAALGSHGAMRVCGRTCDVPLRMIGPSYYDNLMRMVSDLQVPSDRLIETYVDFTADDVAAAAGTAGTARATQAPGLAAEKGAPPTEAESAACGATHGHSPAGGAEPECGGNGSGWLLPTFLHVFDTSYNVFRHNLHIMLRFVLFATLHNFLPRDACLSFEHFLLVYGVVSREDLKLLRYEAPSYEDSQEHQKDRPAEQAGREESIRNIVGAVSWMLSCTREQALRMPAAYLNPYLMKLVFGNSAPWERGGWRRVAPSMTCLEAALSYNLEFEFNSRVVVGLSEENHDGGRFKLCKVSSSSASDTSEGLFFDHVVVAADPMSVKHILGTESVTRLFPHGALDFLDRFPVSRSKATVHTDAALMPPSRRDWSVFNVYHEQHRRAGRAEGSAEEEDTIENVKPTWSSSSVQMMPPDAGSQLTVWYNAFFGDPSYFGTTTDPETKSEVPIDLFVTWNPIQTPHTSKTLRSTSFARVLHDASNAAEVHAKIDQLQGLIPGLYFCGAYSVPGMGLLEEGTKSGKLVASRILSEIFA